ncbi:hypothetical protein [Ferruginibacter sp.]|nr:hypothetical protein [Ferruginibacter sp.]
MVEAMLPTAAEIDIPIGGRYSPYSIQGLNLGVIGKNDLQVVQGAETAVIALNTYGLNYKTHLTNLVDADVAKSTRVANLRFTHKSITKINAGIAWLNAIRPGWDKASNPNTLLFKENKAGANNPSNNPTP